MFDSWESTVAVVVAVLFQVSAPALLRDLSTKPQLRANATRLADALVADDTTQARVTGRRPPSAEALEELAVKFPSLAETMEEASGGHARTDSLREMELILDEQTNRDTCG